jgi:hypothetical protein
MIDEFARNYPQFLSIMLCETLWQRQELQRFTLIFDMELLVKIIDLRGLGAMKKGKVRNDLFQVAE